VLGSKYGLANYSQDWDNCASFPVPDGFRPPRLGDSIINSSWVFFPVQVDFPNAKMGKPYLSHPVDEKMTLVDRLNDFPVLKEDEMGRDLLKISKKVDDETIYRVLQLGRGKDQVEAGRKRERKCLKGQGGWRMAKKVTGKGKSNVAVIRAGKRRKVVESPKEVVMMKLRYVEPVSRKRKRGEKRDGGGMKSFKFDMSTPKSWLEREKMRVGKNEERLRKRRFKDKEKGPEPPPGAPPRTEPNWG